MGFLEHLKTKVDGYLTGDYETFRPRSVPDPEDIPLGNSAAVLEATTMFIDVRQSSDIANAFRRQTAAKMMKAFFDGTVRVINENDGEVRGFNGDGILSVFVGEMQSDNAVIAAMQAKWFVGEILRPRFARYFENNLGAAGAALEFEIGAGIDYGHVYAVRVGIRGTNDVAWVGRCTNTAAKLSDVTMPPNSIAITRAVYERLSEDRKYSEGVPIWSEEEVLTVGGVRRAIRRTSHWRSIH